MADIELVIKIPDHLYKLLMELPSDSNEGTIENVLMKAVEHGTPLPKGHGDLIDRNDLLKHYDSTTYHNGIEERKIHFVQIGYVNDAPTIIEADKESEEISERNMKMWEEIFKAEREPQERSNKE